MLGVYGRIAARFGGRPIIAVSSLAADGLLDRLVRSPLLHPSAVSESSLSEAQSQGWKARRRARLTGESA